MTSCRTSCTNQETVEIPYDWHTPLESGMTLEDPARFLWWEAFDDPLLTGLIEEAACRNNDVRIAAIQSTEKMLETINLVAAEIARNYIELRGLQMRLKVFQTDIEAQKKVFTLGEGLSNIGFINSIDQDENKKNLYFLEVQKSLIELSINKTIFHLSTLLSYPPGGLYEILHQPQELPELPSCIPVGTPCELVQQHPAVREAKKNYEMTRDKQSFYNYQKKILDVFEETENALAAFHSELDKIYYLDNIKTLKADAYQLTLDLYKQGLKDDRDIHKAHQEFLSAENTLIQSKTQLLINYVNLYQALGGGWEADCSSEV